MYSRDDDRSSQMPHVLAEDVGVSEREWFSLVYFTRQPKKTKSGLPRIAFRPVEKIPGELWVRSKQL